MVVVDSKIGPGELDYLYFEVFSATHAPVYQTITFASTNITIFHAEGGAFGSFDIKYNIMVQGSPETVVTVN
jgi:hypothetical protein